MTYQPQRFTAPDGTEMVVLKANDFERLRALAEDGEDVAAALAAEARIEAGEGTMPGEVLKRILDGASPLAAWRRHRGLSQAALARKAGLSQVWVGRIEGGGGYGSRETRRKLADALEAPLWSLEEQEEIGAVAPLKKTGKGQKYFPLQDFLRTSGKQVIRLSFDDIARMVGGLPKSALLHSAWWANGGGHSQAIGWMNANYRVEVDQDKRIAVFTRD